MISLHFVISVRLLLNSNRHYVNFRLKLTLDISLQAIDNGYQLQLSIDLCISG
jgi:hypothetical protein